MEVMNFKLVVYRLGELSLTIWYSTTEAKAGQFNFSLIAIAKLY